MIIPKSKIKTRKRKKKKRVDEKQSNNVPIALQKFSFVNTTEKSGEHELGRLNSDAFGSLGRTDSGPFGLTAVSGQMAGKFFGEATLSNLGK